MELAFCPGLPGRREYRGEVCYRPSEVVEQPHVDIDGLWDRLHADAQGLVVCVVQDLRTRAVLMVAWVTKEALARTLETGLATFYSRSRQCLWTKGETSGNLQRLVQIRSDCDGDTLFYLVEAAPPVCHEGTDTCFSWRLAGSDWKRDPVTVSRSDSAGIIDDLETVIAARATAPPGARPSYTRRLLDGGVEAQVAKLREEAEELADALSSETDARVIAESGDLLYHLAVALRGRGLGFREVFGELARRFGQSGVDEKASRGREG